MEGVLQGAYGVVVLRGDFSFAIRAFVPHKGMRAMGRDKKRGRLVAISLDLASVLWWYWPPKREKVTMHRGLSAALIALAIVLRSVTAGATTIEFTVSSLGGTAWEYQYFPSGHTFLADQGFAVFFDLTRYSNLTLGSPLPADWDPIVVQPDPTPSSDGYYDALALVTDPSLAGPFRVSFLFSGPGTPGSQPFEIYQLEGDFPRPFETGRTVPVGNVIPEPSTLLLLTAGAAAGSALRKRRKPM